MGFGRRLFRWVVWMGLLACLAGMDARGRLVHAAEPDSLLGFTVSLHFIDNSVPGQSTWTYLVQGPGKDGREFRDLSHWTLELCVDKRSIVSVRYMVVDEGVWRELPYNHGRRKYEIGTDPTTRVHGIKFEVEVDKTNSMGVLFEFTLQGQWPVVDDLQVGVKAGPRSDTGRVSGPATCRCMAEGSLTSISYWHILKPGIYAAEAFRFRVHGTAPAIVAFKDFTDARYVADPGAPPIEISYGIGRTLDDVESGLGWMPVEEFNTLTLSLFLEDVLAGEEIVVWNRLNVGVQHQTSDYVGHGKVVVIPVCRKRT
ncbi:MAG: hypothetical protein H0Z37_00720 [Firmicutes bacterium]|nr:hypothetical protein [Bacillota bacterium]